MFPIVMAAFSLIDYLEARNRLKTIYEDIDTEVK